MKNRLKLLATLYALSFHTVIIVVGLLCTSPINAQLLSTIDCDPEVIPTFPENPPATLCSQFGNITSNTIFGLVGTQNATQVIALNGGNPVFTGNVHIVADFEINEDFTFLGCIVKIAPGVKITVKSTKTFTIDNSKLFACQNLWKGISLEYNSNIVTKSSSIIEDAEIAINATVASTLSIRRTTFNRDVIGIELGSNMAPLGGFPVVTTFAYNTFSCDSPINGTTNGVTYAGVRVVQIPVTLGSVVSGINTFKEIEYGIRINNVSTYALTDVARCHFLNILKDGIYMAKGELVVRSCEFTNVGLRGILAGLTRKLEVKYSQFTGNDYIKSNPVEFGNVYYGIFVDRPAVGSQIDIVNNKFDVTFTDPSKEERMRCIGLKGGIIGAGTEIEIRTNDFSLEFRKTVLVPNQSCSAIFVNGEFPTSSTLAIIWNDFYLEQTQPDVISACGIVLTNGNKNNAYIYGNNFTSDTPGEWVQVANGERGIDLNGSLTGINNEVSTNVFPQSSNSVWSNNFANGVSVQDFQFGTYCSNIISESDFGFSFRGTNFGTTFKTNTLIGGRENLRVLDGGIGDQGVLTGEHNGNKWYDKYVLKIDPATNIPYIIHVAPYQHALCYPPQNADLSKFFIHTQQSVLTQGAPYGYSFFSEFHPAKIDPNVNPDWFVEDPQGTPSADNCTPLLQNPPTPESDKLIANGSLSTYFSAPVSIWLSERYLYQKLKANPGIVNNYTSFPSFLNTRSNTTVGKFYEVSNAISMAFNWTSHMQAMSQQYAQQAEALLQTIYTNDDILETSSNIIDFQNAYTAKKNALEQLQAIGDLVASLQSQYEAKVVIDLQIALAANNQIITTQTYEADEKAVNDIILNAIINQNGILTFSQVDVLKTISEKCVKTGGSAVYRARGYLTDCEKVLEDDYYIDCYPTINSGYPTTTIIREGDVSTTSTGDSFKIYPNPSSNYFMVSLEDVSAGSLVITNLFGQVVQSFDFDGSEPMLRVNHELPSGVYICTLHYYNGETRSEKFSISR